MKKGCKKRSKKKNRHLEYEDSPSAFERKCQQLAKALKRSTCTVVYTGAGLSTAASIPDYRGPNGVWTSVKKGTGCHVKYCDPVQTSPTQSHMALNELYRCGYIQHILSQNCDGLHLRSGLPQKSLSEIHGNMHIEICKNCNPIRQYIRVRFLKESTAPIESASRDALIDILEVYDDPTVHFGEYGKCRWPLNWEGIVEVLQRQNCQMILCLGSSLQILQKYQHLWCEDRAKHSRPKLYIVNLQWTPKDRTATLKINGKCDNVMARIMELLNLDIPAYCRSCDWILSYRHRNSRNKEIMNQLTSCKCQNSLKSGGPTSSSSDYHSNGQASEPQHVGESTKNDKSEGAKIPGWWRAGLNMISNSSRRSSSSQLPSDTSAAAVDNFPQKKAGRPRKRKPSNSTVNGTSAAVEIGPKRKRGRPRKNPQEAKEVNTSQNELVSTSEVHSVKIEPEKPLVSESEVLPIHPKVKRETVTTGESEVASSSEPEKPLVSESEVLPIHHLKVKLETVTTGESEVASSNEPEKPLVSESEVLPVHHLKVKRETVTIGESEVASSSETFSEIVEPPANNPGKHFVDWFDNSDSRKAHYYLLYS